VDTSTDGNRPEPPAQPEPIYGYGALPDSEIPAIKLYGSRQLREVTCAVEAFDGYLAQLVQRMATAMYRAGGYGLAAPQIGLPDRVVIISGEATSGTTGGFPVAFVNPMIIEESPELETTLEGCLSFPRVFVKVARPTWVRVAAQAPSGKPFEVNATGLYARVLCHEIDHLNGKLLIDHAESFKRSLIKTKMAKLRRSLAKRSKHE
jgi:peptide deformylase